MYFCCCHFNPLLTCLVLCRDDREAQRGPSDITEQSRPQQNKGRSVRARPAEVRGPALPLQTLSQERVSPGTKGKTQEAEGRHVSGTRRRKKGHRKWSLSFVSDSRFTVSPPTPHPSPPSCHLRNVLGYVHRRPASQAGIKAFCHLTDRAARLSSACPLHLTWSPGPKRGAR